MGESETESFEHRLTELSSRLAALEDQLQISRLMATYGPAVDSLSAEITASLWADEGWYDAGVAVFEGRDGLRQMIDSDMHQGFVRGGCAHIVSAPQITVDGDKAVAVCHSQLLVRDESMDGYRVWRITANRWEWARTPQGWRVTARTNRVLDGSGEARQLFRDSIVQP